MSCYLDRQQGVTYIDYTNTRNKMDGKHPQRRFLVQYDKNYELDVCDLIHDKLCGVLAESQIRFEDHGIGSYECMGTRGIHTNIVPMIDLAFDDIVIELPKSDEPYNLGETISIRKMVTDYHGDDAGEVILMAERSEQSTESKTVYHLFQG